MDRTASAAANLLPGVPLIESPFFETLLPGLGFDAETRRIAGDLNQHGYAIIDFPEPDLDDLAESIKASLAPRFNWQHWNMHGHKDRSGLRLMDAWRVDSSVRQIATNANIIELLSRVYGRQAFPFQTLNFPVGTQQHFHSDALHFNSVPERFMCGVWVALEDVDEANGPLLFYPGSHKWPIFTNEHIANVAAKSDSITAQTDFEPLWEALVSAHRLRPRRFIAKKGQALIWAANLMHGGDTQLAKERTRWSQVTHYFFHGCGYYTPMMSDPLFGSVYFRETTNIVTDERVPHYYNSALIGEDFMNFVKWKSPELPVDWDAALYLEANPDVARAGMVASTHYLLHGRKENRRLRP